MKLNTAGKKVSTYQFKQDPGPSCLRRLSSPKHPAGSAKRVHPSLFEVRTEEKRETKKC